MTRTACASGSSSQRIQRAPFDELHREEERTGRFTELEHARDVGVNEPRRDARFTKKLPAQLAVMREVREQPFQDDERRRSISASEKDLTHAAMAEPLEEFVSPDPRVHRTS
jgi:hypothetical protein